MDRRGYLYGLLKHEARQRIEEGCHREDIQSILDRVSETSGEKELLEAFAQMAGAQVDPGFPFHEPTAWEDLTAVSPGFAAPSGTDPQGIRDLEDRMKGAWFGRCAGCALGKPLERPVYMNWHGDTPGWQGVRIYLKAAEAWPLDWYVPQIDDVGDYGVRCPASTRGKIAFMETDDDIRYTVLGLTILERHGALFTTADVARAWWNTLPIGQTFTAERQAYRNLTDVMDSGEIEANLDYIRGHLNPFREWIGAQIRADGWAYGAAGRPALAAEFAYRDAALSHVKNGIYGEMLFAAAIAAAFDAAPPWMRCGRDCDTSRRAAGWPATWRRPSRWACPFRIWTSCTMLSGRNGGTMTGCTPTTMRRWWRPPSPGVATISRRRLSAP